MFSQGRRLLNALKKSKDQQEQQNRQQAVPKSVEVEREPKIASVSDNEFSTSECEVLNPQFIREVQAQRDADLEELDASPDSEFLPNNEEDKTTRLGSLGRSSEAFGTWNSTICQAPTRSLYVPLADNTPEDEPHRFTQPGLMNVRRQLFEDGDTIQTQALTPVDDLADGVTPLEPLSPVEYQQLSPAVEPTLTPLVYQSLAPVEVPQNQSVQVDNDVFHEEEVSTSNPIGLASDESSGVDVNGNEKTMDTAPENNSQNQNNSEVVDAVPNNGKRSRKSLPSLHTPPRKRQRNPNGTKAAKAKLAYNSGLAHISLRGKEIKARSMKKGCTDTCRKKCQERISERARLKLFQKYYGANSKNSQWHILSKLAHQVAVSRRKVISSSPHRKFSYKYYLADEDGKPIAVCQTMFLDTFNISVSVVQTALKKNSPDKRGKHMNRQRTSPILIQSVKDHIKSFPVIESHYCRENTRKRYLQQNLCVARMYRLYIMQVGEGENTASIRQYREIFNCSFNLGFYMPKKDQCSLCFKWSSLSPEQQVENTELKKEYDEHQEAKTLVRNIRKEVKDYSRSEENNNGRLKVICFDLQKVFFCPKSEVGEFFYKRKISAYNFTVFDCTKKIATCYVWDLTIGGRGAVEISSCVFQYIKREVENGVKEFCIFSDSCWSQNKNKILFTMYYVACQKFGIKITHRYLQKGHTQMECDSVHARIENKTRNTDIFTPMQWYGHILTAKVKKPAYIVFQVQQEHLISYKELALETFKWDKVPVSKVHDIVLDSTESGKVYYKRKLSDPYTCFEVLSKRPGRPHNFVTYKPPQAYNGLIPLKLKLVQDLKYFIQHGLIPENARDFYERVTSPNFGVALAVDEENENDFPEEVTENEEVLNYFLDNHEQEDNPQVVVNETEERAKDSDAESVSSDILD